MKAQEFQKSPTSVVKTRVAPAHSNPLVTKPAITEAKNRKPDQPSHVAPYGVDDAQGHVMKRIREAKPTLWAKIQNWD